MVKHQRISKYYERDMGFPLDNNCGVLCDFIPFLQFKKREKHPWKNVNFSKVAGKFFELPEKYLVFGEGTS